MESKALITAIYIKKLGLNKTETSTIKCIFLASIKQLQSIMCNLKQYLPSIVEAYRIRKQK